MARDIFQALSSSGVGFMTRIYLPLIGGPGEVGPASWNPKRGGAARMPPHPSRVWSGQRRPSFAEQAGQAPQP